MEVGCLGARPARRHDMASTRPLREADETIPLSPSYVARSRTERNLTLDSEFARSEELSCVSYTALHRRSTDPLLTELFAAAPTDMWDRHVCTQCESYPSWHRAPR